MQAYLAIKYHPDNSNRDRITGICDVLHTHDIHTLCIARDVECWGTIHFDAPTLMQKSFAAIDTSDLVVVDLTEKGVGIGIESGYAYAKRLSIVTIALASADISTTLRGISERIYLYEQYEDLHTLFEEIAVSFQQTASS